MATQPSTLNPQLAFDLRISARRPLLPMKAAMVLLDRNEDDILALIQTGKLKWAFDLRCNGTRAFPLIFKGSAEAYRAECLNLSPLNPQPSTLNEVVDLILPPNRPELRATELKNLFSCNQGHIANFIQARLLTISRPGATVTSSPTVTRASVAAFLKQRRIS